MMVLGEGGKPPEKNPQSKAKTNTKLNPHMTPGWNRTRAILVARDRSTHCVIPAHHSPASAVDIAITCKVDSLIACVAAVSFPFQAKSEQAGGSDFAFSRPHFRARFFARLFALRLKRKGNGCYAGYSLSDLQSARTSQDLVKTTCSIVQCVVTDENCPISQITCSLVIPS